jgi:hypothetical protein
MEDRADPWIPVLDEPDHAAITVASSDTYQKNAESPEERKGCATNMARRIT